MSKEEMLLIIRNALAELAKLPSGEGIDNQLSLKNTYGLDSMTSLTFLMTLEERIPGFFVNAETLEEHHLNNVLSVANYVQQELSKNVSHVLS